MDGEAVFVQEAVTGSVFVLHLLLLFLGLGLGVLDLDEGNWFGLNYVLIQIYF